MRWDAMSGPPAAGSRPLLRYAHRFRSARTRIDGNIPANTPGPKGRMRVTLGPSGIATMRRTSGATLGLCEIEASLSMGEA